MGIILSLLLGCLAGFCAGKLMKGGGYGLIMNCVLGLFGGVLGGWLFDLLGISWGGLLGQLGARHLLGRPSRSARYRHHRCRRHPLDRLADQEVIHSDD